MKRIATAIVAIMLVDPTRVLLQAVFLREARRRYPEMFNGAAALASVEACIADFVLHEQP